MAQGLLSFQYEDDSSSAGLTGMAGLPLYLELMVAARLGDVIRRHLKVRLKQGWSDVQHLISLVLLNLAGGDCLDDLKVLEADQGFGQILRAVEVQGLRYRARRGLEKRWRKERKRSVPSASAARRYLEAFHDAEQEKLREPHTAFVPQPNEQLQGLLEVGKEVVSFGQRLAPKAIATLDMDATLIESHKEQAFYCYKGARPLTAQEVALKELRLDNDVRARRHAFRLGKSESMKLADKSSAATNHEWLTDQPCDLC